MVAKKEVAIPRRVLIQKRRDEIFALRAEGFSTCEIARMIEPQVSPQRISQVLRTPRVLKARKSKIPKAK